MQRYTEALMEIGLTLNEAKIYESLLKIKNGTIEDIAKAADIHRRNVYDTIQRLIDKGLAYQILPKKVLTYAPVNPDKLEELVKEKENILQNIMPALRESFVNVDPEQSLAIYKGKNGLKNYIKLTVEEGEKGNKFYAIGVKGIYFEPEIEKFATRMSKRVKNIDGKIIYDESVQKYPDIIQMSGKKKYKFFPKKYKTQSSIAIFGDYVAIYSDVHTKKVSQDITIFIMKNTVLAEDYKKWFDFIWDTLPSVK